MNRTKVLAYRRPYGGGIELLVCEQNLDGEITAIGKDVEMHLLAEKDRGTFLNATLTISTDSAQRLMDELWNCGLRPSEGTGSAGSLRATERHLEDMRKLVFKE